MSEEVRTTTHKVTLSVRVHPQIGPQHYWECSCGKSGQRYRLKSNAVMDADRHIKDAPEQPPQEDDDD